MKVWSDTPRVGGERVASIAAILTDSPLRTISMKRFTASGPACFTPSKASSSWTVILLGSRGRDWVIPAFLSYGPWLVRQPYGAAA